MKVFIRTVVFSLCLVLAASETYKAANVVSDVKPSSYVQLIQEAGKNNADILVLPPPNLDEAKDDYDEIVKSLSQAAKQSSLYVVAHLFETVQCQNETELARSNLVLDRTGAVVSVHRHPVNKFNCTSDPGLVTFSTDFGVTFGSLIEEDLIFHSEEYFEGLKNFVLTGGLTSEVPFLSESLPASWAFISQSNLISSRGIFPGNQVSTVHVGALVFADLHKNGLAESNISPPVVNPKHLKTVPKEVLSQYTIRTLEVDPRRGDCKEKVCHGAFCCDFELKASADHNPIVGHYGLAAFDGVQDYSRGRHIGMQTCAVFPCTGIYKELCDARYESKSGDIMFEKIYMTGNFARNSAQYPTVQSTDVPSTIKFSQTDSKYSVEVNGVQNFTSLGIFGRNYDKDYVIEFVGNKNNSESYNFLSEDVLDFVDYVWIRLRVLIFVVSIYILEMM